MLKDPRYVQINLKVPRVLLRDLDSYAEKNYEGNRSLSIRKAIEQLLVGARSASQEVETANR